MLNPIKAVLSKRPASIGFSFYCLGSCLPIRGGSLMSFFGMMGFYSYNKPEGKGLGCRQNP